jgi:hypothetical protein
MTDFSDIQVVVVDGRGPVYELALWLKDVPAPWCVSQWGNWPDERHWWMSGNAKNLAAAKFLAESDKQYMLVIDNDMVPVPESKETLISTAPIASARHWGRWGGFVHNHGDGVVGMGFTKIRRDVLEAAGPDPFTVEKAGECECAAFCRKAKAAGFLPLEVGFCGHQVPVVVMPDGNGGAMVRAPRQQQHAHPNVRKGRTCP